MTADVPQLPPKPAAPYCASATTPVRSLEPPRMIAFDYLIPVALAAVSVVLLLGLWNMMRGGSASTSQTLMRWRVGLQFVAVCLIMLAFYLAAR